VNTSSCSSRKQYVKFSVNFFLYHFGVFVLVAYRICIERVLKEIPGFFCFWVWFSLIYTICIDRGHSGEDDMIFGVFGLVDL
jgi:hypothetical protein